MPTAGGAMREEFEEHGYYVMRGVLTEAEVDRLAGPIRAGFQNRNYDSHRGEGVYPQPGIYSMGQRVLETHPEIAEVSLAHPKIIAAIEDLFGEPAMLAQFWSIMRPPGAGVSDSPFVNGSASHYDYKPWRCVGSSVKWMFAIIPFVDYIESAGPLVVSPGSHRRTDVLPSNGRVHPVDAARVPKATDVPLVDPGLRKGDVVLMDGFCWHEARPNYGNTDRCGLYMKFQARSAPPACGPTIYPTALHEILPDSHKHLVPHHRDDGRYAAVRSETEDLTGPVGGVDRGQLLIENADDRLLLLGNDTDGWRLPKFEASEDETASILDVCNVMGSVKAKALEELGLLLPWMSWLSDTIADGTDNANQVRCRTYGHRLNERAPVLTGPATKAGYQWFAADEVSSIAAASLLEDAEQVLQWLSMWQHEEDEEGNPVMRSYGLPTTDVQYLRYNGNGNAPGHYRVGEFDEQGRLKVDTEAA